MVMMRNDLAESRQVYGKGGSGDKLIVCGERRVVRVEIRLGEWWNGEQ